MRSKKDTSKSNPNRYEPDTLADRLLGNTSPKEMLTKNSDAYSEIPVIAVKLVDDDTEAVSKPSVSVSSKTPQVSQSSPAGPSNVNEVTPDEAMEAAAVNDKEMPVMPTPTGNNASPVIAQSIGARAGTPLIDSTPPTATATESATVSQDSQESVKVNSPGGPKSLKALPNVYSEKLDREFYINELEGVEITSMDITPHGCYVLAGCGNGMVLLFDMTQPYEEPACVGHILAKGLHTNLLMTVRITEDCRFCFAGVTKGSSEMLAIDLSRLPVWTEQSKYAIYRRRPGFVNEVIRVHRKSDPKLRGFGAAVRANSSSKEMYRLATGLGIKNVHVWQYESATNPDDVPSWSCIYDVVTNGSTINFVGFRCGGTELMSKSAGVNLRVWDLKKYDENPEAKPDFHDVTNSQDVRSLSDTYAFGGTYEFAIVHMDAPKAANRDALEMPVRADTSNDGSRKRRQMRQIEAIRNTQDAKHALVLCADGGVLYFNGTDVKAGMLSEISELQRDTTIAENTTSTGRDWNIARVGAKGDVVLMYVTQSKPLKVVVRPLSRASAVIPETFYNAATLADPSLQYSLGYYQDPAAGEYHANRVKDPPPIAQPKSSKKDIDAVAAAPKSGKPPLAPGRSGVKRPPKSRVSEDGASSSSAKRPASVTHHHQQQAPSAVIYTPSGPLPARVIDTHNEKQRKVYNIQENSKGFSFTVDEPPQRVHRSLTVGSAPRVRRIKETPIDREAYLRGEEALKRKRSADKETNVASIVMGRFKSMCKSWINEVTRNRQPSHGDIIDANAKGPFGLCALRKIGEFCVEQDRVRAQFVVQVTRMVGRCLMALNEKQGMLALQASDSSTSFNVIEKLPLMDLSQDLEALIHTYKSVAVDLIQRQSQELFNARSIDHMVGEMDQASTGAGVVIFRHKTMWNSSRSFVQSVQLLVNAAVNQRKGS